MKPSLLDDPAATGTLDAAGMLGTIARSPGFATWVLATHAASDGKGTLAMIASHVAGMTIKGVFIVGMGGSAISGDLLADWLRPVLPVPLLVFRDYDLPPWIDRTWLGIFLSYSGNTEETLSTYIDAKERGIPGICITAGGALGRFAAATGDPRVEVPGGLQPRAALLYLFPTLAITFSGLGLVDGPAMAGELRGCIPLLEDTCKRYGPDVPAATNPAKQLAMKLHGTVAAIYGFGQYTSVARRFKGQINENGKNPAYFDVLSELNHNETVGWENDDGVTGHVSCIMIRDPDHESPAIATRAGFTRQLVEKKAASIIELQPTGTSRLARMLSLVLLADYASTYLAILNGKDPTPVEYIQGLKDELGRKVNMLQALEQRLSVIAGKVND